MLRKAAVFDLDGTLIDSLQDIISAVNGVREEMGLAPLSREGVREGIGKGAEFLIKTAFPQASPSKIPELRQKYIQRYLFLEKPETRAYPGAVETLQVLKKKGYVLGVCTNKSQRSSEEALARLLPEIDFECVIGFETAPKPKPHPDHLLAVLQGLQADPGQSFYVGDDPVDRMCAEAAKVRFFAAEYGIGGVKASPGLKSISDLLQYV